MEMIDHVLDRITWDPKASVAASAAHHPSKLRPIPWPTDLAPIPEVLPFQPSDPTDAPLFKVDSVIVTWTAAEWQALTDVLSPDHGQDKVLAAYERAYAHDFASYLPDLTDRSPAKSAKCLARYRMSMGNGKNVLLVHSQLHLATDGPNLPLRQLISQIIDETQCARLITVGTGGGLLPTEKLGDIVVGQACKFNCRRQLAYAAFAQATYPTTLNPGIAVDLDACLATNADMIAGLTRPIQTIGDYDIETLDYFGFGTTTDAFQLLDNDPSAAVCEMDDAVFGLVVADRMTAAKPCPEWLAI
ncbi:MAG TPA: hypothetical protein VKT80_10325, partial [Chloroflexota bacterium]|nr:hypothetical protein [Chloroflexota bacterium]